MRKVMSAAWSPSVWSLVQAVLAQMSTTATKVKREVSHSAKLDRGELGEAFDPAISHRAQQRASSGQQAHLRSAGPHAVPSRLMRHFGQAKGFHQRWQVHPEASHAIPFSNRTNLFTGFFSLRPQASTVPSFVGFCSSAPPRSIQSAVLLQHGMQVVDATHIVEQDTVLPTVHTRTSLPSFSSTCMVYSDVFGGVFNFQGLSLLRFSIFLSC
jgi:hypothetical protein